MGPTEMRRLLEDMYAAHAILWSLGFDASELFVSAPNILNAPVPGRYATLIVRRGEQQFTYWMTPRLEGEDVDRFLAGWLAFAARVKRIPRDDLDALVKRSVVWREKTALLSGLAAKGFRFTACEN